MTLKIEMGVDITGDDIDDIVATALEGGINYWCIKAEVGEEDYFGQYASDQISRGGTLRLYLDEPYNDTEMFVLTEYKLINGIKQYLEDPNRPYEIVGKGSTGANVIDCGMVDAIVADMIIQYALFDEVVFG
jgi:hypothetical protein